ncbi:MAG TPA: MMPL family transporter [Solirubrobacteraceae bacterium]|jgi:RND superfamily putative drug exporter
MLARLATFINAHRRPILFAAVGVAVLAGVFGFSVAKHMSSYGATDPATQSIQAERRFEAGAGRKIAPGVVAIVSPGDLGSPAGKRRVEQVASRLRAEPGVANVAAYYETRDPAMVSHDHRSTYVVAYLKPRSDKDTARHIEALFSGQHDVRLGGEEIASAQANRQVGLDLARAELLAFPFIFLLSLLFFRSLVASLIPPLIGGLAIVMSFLALRIIASFTDLSVFALNFVTGMGLGLAIDYSLFMLSRYREEATATGYDLGALQRTLQTSGRTILFSALTVAAAIASLMIFPQRFLYSMGVAGAVVAILAATLALLVLPALLALLGQRVNSLAPKALQRAADRDALPAQSGAWYRLAQYVRTRPRRVAGLATGLLIALGLPFTGINFTTVTARVLPASASARQVDDALAREFPPNRTSPVQVVVGAPAGSPRVAALAAKIVRLPDVSAVSPAQAAGKQNALLAVSPVQRPLSQPTKQLVRDIRAIRAPVYVGVAGQTANFLDLEHSLAAHLPLVLGLIVAATVIILFLFTGSVVLPLKAVLMNALSLSAVLGILVLIFQDGNLQGLLSFTSEGALDATQPIFLAAIGFGLATDYGVFLLSRIKEARDNGTPDSEAVAVGLERTGRIITAAAILFAVAIAAFATSKLVFIKELGVGTALAVLIDASIIRALLVPALMELLGSWNWWAPKPLRRLHDRIGLRERTAAVSRAPEPTRA